MEPIDYHKLKVDKEYAYHVKTQMNLIGWLIKKPVEKTRINCIELLELIKKELEND